MSLIQNSKQAYGYIRFLYAYPESRCICITIDDKPIQKKWYYEDFTKYLKVPYGYHTLCFKDAQTDAILLEKKLSIKPHAFFTYLYTTHPKQLGTPYLLGSEEQPKHFSAPYAFIRLENLSVTQPQVGFQLKEDPLLYKRLNYLQINRYFSLDCKPYTFQIVPFNEPDTLLADFKKTIKPFRFYTLYFIGNGTKLFPYHLILSIDAPSFLSIKRDIAQGSSA